MLLPVHLNGRLECNGGLCIWAVYWFFVAGGARLLLNVMFDFCCLKGCEWWCAKGEMGGGAEVKVAMLGLSSLEKSPQL